MARYDTRLITPPTEEEEIYPYRRVWLSILIETGMLFAFVGGLYVLTRFVSIPEALNLPVNMLIVFLPVALWLIFSWWRERLVPLPRERLIAVAVVTALLANAISLPVTEQVFQVQRWLPLESAINRIVGYTFTTGLVQTIIIYLAMRYTVWPGHFRIRLDGVAYGAASAIGYATVLNLRVLLTDTPIPTVTAMNTFDQVAVLMCTGIIIGYGMAEVAFNRRVFPLLLMATIALAAFITGVAIPLIAGFANARISVLDPVGTVNPLLGFLFATGLLFVVSNVFSFLFNVAERQEADEVLEEAESLWP